MLELILINYGLCAIVTHGEILQPLRSMVAKMSERLYHGITCMQCTGFWCGLALSLIIGYGWMSVLYAFLLSGTNELIDAIIKRLDR